MRVFNFSPGPGGFATGSAGAGASRNARLARHRHVGDGDEPSRQGVHLDCRNRRKRDLRELLAVPKNYKVLFLQGGATGQFAAVPMNLAEPRQRRRLREHRRVVQEGHRRSEAATAKVNVAADAGEPYTSIPPVAGWKVSDNAAYLHYTPNETIGGVEFHFVPEVEQGAAGRGHVLHDAVAAHRCFQVRRHLWRRAEEHRPRRPDLVIVREDLLGHARPGTPAFMDFTAMAKEGSMLNTPPTFAWYIAGLVFQWLKRQGGLQGMGEINRRKAEQLYAAIDGSSFYKNPVAKDARSWMNIPFTLARPELDKTFTTEAKDAGLVTLEGHRSVGGMRASIYNAMPLAGVEALVGFMKEFERKHG